MSPRERAAYNLGVKGAGALMAAVGKRLAAENPESFRRRELGVLFGDLPKFIEGLMLTGDGGLAWDLIKPPPNDPPPSGAPAAAALEVVA